MNPLFSRRHALAGVLSLSLAASVLLAGCGSTSSTPSADASGSPAVSPQTPSESPSATLPAEDTDVFQPGTWLSDQGQYYFFDDDGASGRTASLEDGTGVSFSYTVDGDQAAFSMGGADSTQTCTLSGEQPGGPLTLQWEDGTAEVLTYVSEQNSDQFQFYSNQELCDLALAYYGAHSDGQSSEGLTAAAQTNEDGTVTIQVYQNLGDHNSTAAWYTVDRTTAQGTDGAGQAVDLAG